MGRPLNKKYFGNRDFGSPAVTTDDGLLGQSVAGITVGTAGTYTSATVPTLTFPDPLLKVSGAVAATGTPTFKVVSATVTGAGSAYANSATQFTVTTAFGTATVSITPAAGSLAGTVTIVDAGSFTGMSAGAQSVVGGTGTGGTITLTYGLLGATMTEVGSGYLPAAAGTATITGTTVAQTATTITSTIANNIMTVTAVTGTILNNMILSGGSVTAGAYVVNQLSITGAEVVGGAGRYYIEKYQGGAITGTPTTGTLNAITVSSTVGMQPGMTFTIASSVGGLLTSSNPYYIISQLGPNTVQVGATINATTGSILSTTTLQTVLVTFGQALGVTVSTGTGTATTALVPSVTTNNTTGSINAGIKMTAFLEAADGGKASRQLTDIVKQVSGTRYKVKNQDGTGIVKLTNGSVTAGSGIITAFDSAGGAYFVTKLTGHKATVEPKASPIGGTQFPLINGVAQQVQWVFDTAVLNTSVKIDNG